jgi:hypothetical protein
MMTAEMAETLGNYFRQAMTNPVEDPGAFASYLNAMPDERKVKVRKALRKALSEPVAAPKDFLEKIRKDNLTSAITTTTNLVPYSLEAPALELWPVVTPIRNMIPRRTIGGTGHHWKRINKIDTVASYGFVAEPTDTTANTNAGRAGFMTLNEQDASIVFKAFGLDNYVTFMARYGGNTTINSGENFQPDEVARLATLQALMMREEKAIIGANSIAFGNVTGITKTNVTQSATGIGSLTAGTAYYFQISALSFLGFLNGSTGNNGSVNSPGETGAASQLSISTASGGNPGDKAITITWTPVVGAVAYNVFTNTSNAGGIYQATVYTNFYCYGSQLAASTNVVNTSDQSADANGFDGLIKLFAVNGGYVSNFSHLSLAAGPTASQLNSSAAGATWTGTNLICTQLDTAFQQLAINYKLGPDIAFVSFTDRFKLDNIIVGTAVPPYLMINGQMGSDSFIGGISAGAVLNRYMQKPCKIVAHPYLPAGTVILWTQNLGQYYPVAKVPNPVEMLLGFDYMSIDWAPTSLRQEFGIYAYGAPTLRAGFPMGLIQGPA